MKKTITIGNKQFIVKKPVERLELKKGLHLFDCYTRPSQAKFDIWNEWQNWAWDNDVRLFGIVSYNFNMFTLQGETTLSDGTTGRIYITKTRQEFYPYFS